MNNLEELMLDRIIKQAEKIVEQNLRIKELEQQLAVVQEREVPNKAEQHAQADEAVEDAESLPEIPEGFIRHDGGECPVENKKILLTFRNYDQSHAQYVTNSNNVFWRHRGATDDIIAYKVIDE